MKRIILLWSHDGHLISVFPVPDDVTAKTAFEVLADEHDGHIVRTQSDRIAYFNTCRGVGPERWLKLEVRMLPQGSLNSVLTSIRD